MRPLTLGLVAFALAAAVLTAQSRATLDIYSIDVEHFSLLGGQEWAAPGAFIANTVDQQPSTVEIGPMPPAQPGTTLPPAPTHSGPAYWIKLSAQQDGSFTVTNSRNGLTKTYRPRTTVQGTR